MSIGSEELISKSRAVSFSDGVQREIAENFSTKLLGYVELLSKWTQKMSLVSSPDKARIIDEHIIDCWAAAQIVPRETFYLDIGSGAGLPGVVIAILNPESRVILLEPRSKRVEFLKEVRRGLKLENVDVVMGRLEDWECEDNIGRVSAVERAVGMEGEIFSLLKGKLEDFSLSLMVAEGWNNTVSSAESWEQTYKLENGTRHVVKCFT
jgi:16S rRNA (guanine(527)-N(7))-methyltransferase RsmG